MLSWTSDAVSVHVLVNVCVHVVETKLLQFAKADSSYLFLLYAGHVLTETGNWVLQDGTMSFSRFAKIFGASCRGTGPIDVATFPIGEWNASGLVKLVKHMRLNPEKPASSGGDADVSGFTKFASTLASHILLETVPNLLQNTDVIGAIPFSRPTVNIFQGGNGVSTMFGVRGCSMLVDTGFPRRTCSWDFVRHMDYIDVVILPQIGENNVLGAKSFVERLAVGDVRTRIGQVFINAGTGLAAHKATGDEAVTGDCAAEQSDSLLLSLNDVSKSVVECLAKSQIMCALCVGKVPPQPLNLYHKIGFGSVDMYILNPVADSKDLKDFLASWAKMPKSRGSKLNDLVSISTVIAFKPETRGDHPVRILFPGAFPVKKLYESLDRLKTNPLFQTAGGCAAAQKSAGGTARAAAGTGKPGATRPVSTSSSGRDAQPSKAAARSGVSSAADSKKTASESVTAKSRDRKTPRDAKAEPKTEDASQKDTKGQSTSSSPRKDAQKTAARKNVSSAAKGSTVPPAKKEPTKAVPSPVRDSAVNDSNRNDGAKAEIPTAGEVDVKPDAAATDSNVDVIPELVPCTTEEDTVVFSGIDPQVVSEQGDNHVAENASDSAQVGELGSAGTEVDNVKVAATEESTAVEPAEGESLQAGAEVDPIQSWDAPQSLPAPSDDKGERQGAAGRTAPKDRSSAGAGRRADHSNQPPASARSTSSAASGTKKGAPSKAITPFYVDLAYVPTYAVDGCDAEFFHRVRARYYVIPGSSADPHQLSMLADAKSSWEGEVTVIPTGNTDALAAWIVAHRDELASLKIEVAPSVARSTLHLDRGSSCAAYRLEF